MFSKFSVKKPYTVVVGVVLILILGFVTFTNMTVDLLPDMNLPYAIVMTAYPGASPEEVETTVTKPVEQAMATVSNISSIQSSSAESASTVILEFEQTANMDSATIEMRETLDQIQGYWPDGVANPVILKLNPSMMPILIAAVSVDGENAADTSKYIEEQVIPEIESTEGVASVTSYGSIEEFIRITINEKEIENLNSDALEKLNEQFKEAEAALADARAEVENGKAALESGQSQASGQLGQAEAQMAVQAEELKQAQLEITERKAELNVGETQLSQNLTLIQTSRAAMQAQLEQLEALKQNEDAIRAAFGALSQKNPEELTEEERAELQELTSQIAMLQRYEETKEQLESGIAGFDRQENELNAQREQLEAGRAQLKAMEDQVNAGALTLAQARAQMSSAQLTAAVEISRGASRLAVGESAIEQQETQMNSAREEAQDGADLTKILTADMVRTLLSAQNFNMPAGYIQEDGTDYLIRVGDKFRDIEELKDLVLMDAEGMDPIRLSDVADVELLDNSGDTYAKINGEPGVMLSVQKQTGYSTGEVSDRVMERLEALQNGETGLHTITLMDQGVYIDLVVRSVLQNLLYGAVLAILILLVFLKSVRSTLIIAFSIPISIMTALTAMYFSGVTLNIISLSGLALGVGMLVDNSIVVIENIYRMRNEEGASAKDAAVEGARQVAGAITASTLTTICVFVPIIFTEGMTRQLFVDMGLTIAFSLLASLLTAVTLVPMMSAGILKKTEVKETAFFDKLRRGYAVLLGKALRRKALVLLGALVLLVLSGVLAASRGTEFMPQMESTEVSMTLEMEKDSTLEETAAAADAVMERVGQIEDIQDLGGMIGSIGLTDSRTETNTAQFYAITAEHPKLSNAELKRKIETAVKDLDGELTVNMSSMDMSALGNSGIVVQIRGKELDTLQQVASDVKEIVSGVKGTQNVLDGTEDNDAELRVIVDKSKAVAHGLTVAQVYQELYAKISDTQAAAVLSTDTDDYDIYVKVDADENMSREDVKNLTIQAAQQDGTTEEVRLADIAGFEDASGLRAISRMDQSRYMSVTAEIRDGDNIGLVSSRINRALENYDAPEGYEIRMAGEDETINEAMREVLKMLVLAIVFMYLIMVAQFQSLRSPFIVMFTVPLAFTGGLLGLWLTGSPVSVVAMIGFVMLSGIIVNNGIVFIDYTNQLLEGGMTQREALIEAGKTRLRPIIMTALTTILGLLTMALGVGMGAGMVQPMAIVTIGGLSYGTLLTLFVVPCIFDLFHKREKARLIEGMSEQTEEQMEKG